MKHVARWLLAAIVLTGPLAGDLIHFSLFPIAMAVVVVSDGLTPRTVLGSVAFLMAAEILWGVDFGVLSLAYLGMVLALRVAEYSIAIIPLDRQGDWSAVPLIRGIFLAWVLSLIMTFFSAAVQSAVYHQGSLAALVSAAYHPVGSVLGLTALAAACGIIALHRIRIPFRKRISFGI